MSSIGARRALPDGECCTSSTGSVGEPLHDDRERRHRSTPILGCGVGRWEPARRNGRDVVAVRFECLVDVGGDLADVADLSDAAAIRTEVHDVALVSVRTRS